MAGQCPALLKWKPPSLNTVDFKLAIVEHDRPGYTSLSCVSSDLWFSMLRERVGQLWVGGYHVPFSQIDLKVRIIVLQCVHVVMLEFS